VLQAMLRFQQAGRRELLGDLRRCYAVVLADFRNLQAQGIWRHINPEWTRNEYMGLGLRKVGKAVLVICAGLLLTACAEDFGPDQHGRKVTADCLDGQWLIINYWAEWCAPCRTEIPELNALEETLKNQSARVIGVNFDALQGDDLKRAADSFDIRFTVLAQDPAARFELPRTDVLPVTYIVDAEGKLRERLVGEQTSAGLLAHLERLRGE